MVRHANLLGDMQRIQFALKTCILLGFVMLQASATAQQSSVQQNQVNQQARMKTLAIVNGHPISRQQLATECLRRFGNEVLESIINKELILTECRRLNIVITDAQVADEIKRRAKSFGMSSDRYIKLISEQRHISADKFRSDIIWTELALRRLAEKQIQVTQAEVNQRFETQFGPKVHVQAIFVKEKALADKIHAQVVADPDSFGKLAMKHSIDPRSAPYRGMLPPIRKHLGNIALEKAAFALQPNQLSAVEANDDHFMILKCIRHYPADEINPAFKDQAVQRIVDQIRQDKLRESSIALFKRLQETVKITNVYNDANLRQQYPGVAAMINNMQIRLVDLQEECITRYGRDVLESEINRTILEQELQRSGLQVSESDIMKEISSAAVDYGFTKNNGTPDIDRWLQEVTQGDKSQIEIYVADEVRPSVALKKLVEKNVKVTQEDLQKSFEANFGPRVRALAIVFDNLREANSVWVMARDNLSEKYFGELAHQYSKEQASRAHNGVVPPIQKHGGRPMLEEEAFKLKPGEMSGVIPVGKTWVVLYCQGHTTPVVTEFDDVKDELQKDIHNKKLKIAMTNKFNDLRMAAQIDNFLKGTSQSGGQRHNKAQRPGNGAPAGQLPFRGNK